MLYLFRPFRARGKKFKSQQPWFSSLQSVRDCSGILCEIMGFGIRERGFGNLEIFLSEAETEASKDIAESPTRSGTPR